MLARRRWRASGAASGAVAARCGLPARPEHRAHHRQQEDMAADHRRDRVARQADHRRVAEPARHQRFARAASRPCRRPAPCPRSAATCADQIVVADRGAADGHDQVGAARQPEARSSADAALSRAMGSSRGSAPMLPPAARAGRRLFEAMIWSGPGSSPGMHQFVPGRDQRDHRAARDGHAARHSSRPAARCRWASGGAAPTAGARRKSPPAGRMWVAAVEPLADRVIVVARRASRPPG